MKILKVALLALLLANQSLFAAQIEGKIVKITDGDTVVLLSNQNKTIKVRLAEIDAPEKINLGVTTQSKSSLPW